jgi:hypothetical protein
VNKKIYLRIALSEQRKYIYRIIPVQRLFEFFKTGQNVLVEPAKWKDPFENFILRSRKVYGQCWTLQSASDAIWRIYSPESDAIRIRSTVRRVGESLSKALGNHIQGDAFIGRVRYLRNEKLMSFAKDICGASATASGKMIAETLLVKRPAFRHEREVRLVFVPNNVKEFKHECISYPVDPHVLIDQIMIDPRMSVKQWKNLREEIKSKTGFRGTIKRSLLYAPPPDVSAWSVP